MTVNYYGQARAEMLPFIPNEPKRVLEIGCGEGGFREALAGAEEYWGVEPTPAAEVARTRLTHVLQMTFEQAEAELPKRYFDLIVCNDVIEHMPNHKRFLEKVIEYLTPSGMLIGSIPNVRYYENMMQFLLEKDWMYGDHGILDRTHMAFFTAKSLRRTLERSGFKVECLTGINKRQGFSGTVRDRVYLAAAHVGSVITAGYFADILYKQFAFQAVPRQK